MPELPEVETVVRELRPLLRAKVVQAIETLWPKTFQNGAGFLPTGQSIRKIDRHGKYIILQLEKSYLIIHLRMTGRLTFQTAPLQKRQHPHLRVILHFSDGSRLLFEDTRKFGRIYHVTQTEEILKNVGMDALDAQFTFEQFYHSMHNRKMGVKAFLMSQKWIAGLGNIYTDESLFLAQIHPETPCAHISPSQAQQLFEAIQYILKQAVKNMGSTISDYRDAYGNPGQNQLYFKVYRRSGQPCFVCGTPIVKKRVAGRGTHFCPVCQKLGGES